MLLLDILLWIRHASNFTSYCRTFGVVVPVQQLMQSTVYILFLASSHYFFSYFFSVTEMISSQLHLLELNMKRSQRVETAVVQLKRHLFPFNPFSFCLKLFSYLGIKDILEHILS